MMNDVRKCYQLQKFDDVQPLALSQFFWTSFSLFLVTFSSDLQKKKKKKTHKQNDNEMSRENNEFNVPELLGFQTTEAKEYWITVWWIIYWETMTCIQVQGWNDRKLKCASFEHSTIWSNARGSGAGKGSRQLETVLKLHSHFIVLIFHFKLVNDRIGSWLQGLLVFSKWVKGPIFCSILASWYSWLWSWNRVSTQTRLSQRVSSPSVCHYWGQAVLGGRWKNANEPLLWLVVSKSVTFTWCPSTHWLKFKNAKRQILKWFWYFWHFTGLLI